MVLALSSSSSHIGVSQRSFNFQVAAGIRIRPFGWTNSCAPDDRCNKCEHSPRFPQTSLRRVGIKIDNKSTPGNRSGGGTGQFEVHATTSCNLRAALTTRFRNRGAVQERFACDGLSPLRNPVHREDSALSRIVYDEAFCQHDHLHPPPDCAPSELSSQPLSMGYTWPTPIRECDASWRMSTMPWS